MTLPEVDAAPKAGRVGRLTFVYRRVCRPGTLARELAQTASTNTAIAFVGGLGGILLARALGPVDRGLLVTIVQWPAVACTLASLGITQAVTYRVGRDPESANDVVSTGTVLAVVSGAIVALVGLWLAPVIGRRPDAVRYLAVVLALAPGTISYGLWTSAFQAVDIDRFNVTRAIQPLAYFLGVTALFVGGQLRLGTAVACLVAAQLVALALTFLSTRRAFSVRFRLHRAEAGALYRYGAVVAVGMVPRIVNVRLDLLVLSVLPSVSLGSLGVYAVAASLTWLVLPLSVAFGTVAFPRLARAHSSRGSAQRVERIAVLGAVAAATGLVLVLAGTAPWVVPALFGRRYRGAVPLVWLLSPGTVCLAVNQVMGDVLRGRGHPFFAVLGEATAAILTVAGLAVFARAYGTTAAATVSSVAYAVTTAVLWRLIRAGASGNGQNDDAQGPKAR